MAAGGAPMGTVTAGGAPTGTVTVEGPAPDAVPYLALSGNGRRTCHVSRVSDERAPRDAT